MKERLVFIDGLRGIAASMVVLYHLISRTDGAWLASRGYLGVAVFFVLSGFVIAMSVGSRPMSFSFLWRFAARRAVRLDPPYWLSLALDALIVIAMIHIGMQRELPSMEQVVAHLFYAQDLLGVKPISDVYWTLCLEIQFYLFLILLLWGMQSLKVSMRSWTFDAAFLALLAVSVLAQGEVIGWVPRGLFLTHWYAFALGAAVYWTVSGVARPTLVLASIAVVLATITLAAPIAHGDWLVAAAAVAAVIFLASALEKIGQWLSGPVFQFLGKISYSLYLFHALIGWSAMSVALKFANQWIALGVGIGASLVCATAVYHTVEKFSIKLSRKVELSRKPGPVKDGALVPA